MIKRDLSISLVTKMVKNRASCIMIPKMSAYRRDFDETKYISFFIKDDKLLEKHNETCDKVSNSIKRGFDSEPVNKEKIFKQ